MIWLVIYLLGCLFTAHYCVKNLQPGDIGDYYKSAVVVTTIIWPLLVVVVLVLLGCLVVRRIRGL